MYHARNLALAIFFCKTRTRVADLSMDQTLSSGSESGSGSDDNLPDDPAVLGAGRGVAALLCGRVVQLLILQVQVFSHK